MEFILVMGQYGKSLNTSSASIKWRNILGQAAFQLIVLFIFMFEGDQLFSLNKDNEHELTTLNTIIFNCFVFCQIFNEMNARDMTKLNVFQGFFTNSLFVSIIVISCVFQVIIVQYFGKGASVATLSSQQWLISVGIAAITLPMGIVVKLFPVPDKSAFQLYAESKGYTSSMATASLEKRVVDLEAALEDMRSQVTQFLTLKSK